MFGSYDRRPQPNVLAPQDSEEPMDKKIAGLLGAVAGLATIGTAQAAINPAAVPDTLQASSYTGLLSPIAHPIALLKADDAARAQKPAAEPAADFQAAAAHHHHHHHHTYSRNYHHYHHYNRRKSAFFGVPGLSGVVINRR
jgi:hypothetical protein